MIQDNHNHKYINTTPVDMIGCIISDYSLYTINTVSMSLGYGIKLLVRHGIKQ